MKMKNGPWLSMSPSFRLWIILIKKEQLCNCKLCIDLDLHGALMKTIFLRFSALKGAKTRETMLKRACETYNVLNRRRIVLLPFTYTPKNASDLSKSASDQIAGPLEVPFFRIRFNHVAYSYLAFRPSSTFQEALDKLTEKFSDFAIIYPDVVAQSGYLHVLHTILKEVLKTGRTSAEGAKDLKDTLYSLSGWESSPTSSETSTNQGIINDALTSAVSGSMKFTGPATPERKPKNAAALIMEKRKVDGAGNKESRHRRRVVADDEPAIPSDLAQQAEEGKRMIANRRMTMLRDTVHLAEKTEVSISYSLPMVPSHSLQQGTIQHILDLLDYQISQMVDFPLFPYFRKCALLRLLFSESSCTADNLAKYSAAGIGQKTQSLSHQRSTSYGKMSISFDNLDSRCTLTKQDIDEWNPISRLPTVMTDSLPENWVVCAISLVTKETLPLFGASPSDVLYIVVTRWEKGLPAITMRIPVRSKTNKTVESLQEIHKKANRNQLHHAGARDYWNTRLQLNDDVAQVTESMENNLGYARALFLTAPADKTVDEALKGRMRSLRSLATKNSIEFNAPFVRLIALAGLYLSKNELEKFAVDLFGYDKEREWEVKTIVKFVLNKPVVTGSDICYERHPVVLIPDNNAFNLPWESMPILRNHPVSRMPSVATLNSHLDRYRRVLNTDNGFYILNPTADLMEMQKRFEKFFENERLNTWEGVSGKVPSKETIAAALSQRELIVYMGHGSGDGIFSSHLYSARDISANMFLIGCSSVRLQHGPMMDGTAFFNRCLMTGSRCILGNLWMVTSGCIDSMMSSLLTDLLSVSDKAEEKKGEKWFQALLAICRERTRSNFLVGAAPVVIGLPMVY
ncbi:uncharacterized protein LOC129601612 [Paramacrobiotus metropolitanus]|uniref:uncharacterized protein LOC129601612 n=1 Tax=Paramacrobiotus metropolitanus TaxID=2943436 RepID=UPI0024462317|nr:uncharacterized protein LOC129601612 [Paramacrobiotus metropolitanus]